MPLYTLINLIILAGPLSLSFDKRVAFFRYWPALVFALVPVSGAYLVWDAIVTEIGHWGFSERYAGTFKIAGLPIGEILFFITVPYACIFIYEVARAYFKGRSYATEAERSSLPVSGNALRMILVAVAALFVVPAIVFGGYTSLAAVSIVVLLLLTAAFDPWMWVERHTLYFFLLSYIPFLLANGVLTALPIVSYSPEAILGARVYTIPVEDFFYNLGMLGFYLFFFRIGKKVFSGSKQAVQRDES